ncbi:hypothetical protein Dimus_023216, partial [Dionaea muscipula]
SPDEEKILDLDRRHPYILLPSLMGAWSATMIDFLNLESLPPLMGAWPEIWAPVLGM